jgi:hypothetical protein
MHENTLGKFNLEGTTTISTESKEGEIVLNNMAIKKEETSGIFATNIPVRLFAIPNDGHQFSLWVINGVKNICQNMLFTPTTES